MKKISILLMLMALFGPLAMMGQTRVTGGWGSTSDNSGTTSNAQNSPFGRYYGWEYKVFCYRPNTLDFSGVISQIGFLPSTTKSAGTKTSSSFTANGSTDSNPMQIWMKEVDGNTTLDASTSFQTYVTGATKVYSGEIPATTAGTMTSFTLSTNFTHSQENCLLILVRTVANGTTGDGAVDAYYKTLTGGLNLCWYQQQDSSDPGITTTADDVITNNLPVLQVTYTASTTPSISLSPNSATVITGSDQTLTATVRNVSGTPTISYSSSNTSVATVSGSGTTATVTGVSAGTATITATLTYQGSTYTATSAITVKEGAVVGDAWSDDFEGTSCGWELINGTLTNQWVWGTAVNNGGTHALYISKDGGTSNTYSGAETKVFAAKLLSFTEGKFTFSYDWRCKGESTWDFLRVALVPASQTLTAGTDYSTITQPGLPTGWIALDGGKLNLQETWQSKEVTINVTAGNYYMVLAWRNETGTYDPPAAVDNVSITRVACPYDVEDLAVSGTPTTTSATVIWTAGSASQWQVEYSTSSSFPAGSSTQTVSSATATLSPLQPSSTYYVRVRSYCGGTDYGTWSSVISVNTACDAITTLPWSEDFTGLTSGIPNCWDNSDGTTTSDSYKWNYYNDGHTATPCLRFDSYYNGTGNTNFLKTPVLDLSSWSDVTLSFAFKNPAGGDFSVYISTDGGSTYTTLLQGGLTGQSTWTEIEDLDLSDYDGEDNVVIVFKGTSNYGSSGAYIYLDDVRVDGTPSGAYTITCATTTGGTISADKNKADENDVVTITATPETDYTLTALTYTPEGGSAQNINIASTPYTFTMPAANVTVNATFTQPTCPKPTNLTVSNLAASHANVSWDSEVGNYTVKYSTATVSGTTLDPVFEDGFENGLGNWTIYATAYDNASYNWQQYDLSSAEVEPYNHSGDYVAMSRSWVSGTGDQSVDNWLVTPQMTLGDVVKFWVSCNDQFRDSYAVYVSTGSNVVTSSSIGDFVLVKSYAEATGTWTEIPVDISAYAGQQGYVAIRHTNYGGDKLNVDDFGVYNTINTYSYGGWTTVSPNPTTESCQLTGLSAETLYAVQVQAHCGGTDGSSAWSTFYFTTPDNCGAPQELASSNITATSATLSWADDKDSYNLQYRKVYFYEDFEGSDGIPTGWTTINNSSTAGSLNWQVLHLTNHSGNNSVGSGSYIYQNTGITPDNWLISPQLDLQGTLRVWLTGYGDRYAEHFEILLSTTGTSVSDFTTTLVAESTTSNSYMEYTADLSSYTGKGYIAIHHFNCSDQNYLCVDDFGIYGSENWVTLNPNPTTETANLTGLTPIIENDYHLLPTTYEWQVQGVNCDGNGGTTEWSDVATFTTLEGYVLQIDPWASKDWYLIASPIGTVNPTAVTNMISDNLGNTATAATGTYDLYAFNQNQNLEWQNYRQNTFNLVAGQGYLYASKNGADLVFSGSAYTDTGTFNLTYSTDNSEAYMHGWNLVGNPFAEEATVEVEFMEMNDGHSDIVPNLDYIVAPMEGIFVHATATGQSVTFTPVSSGKSADNGERILIDISQDQKVIDRAAVRFGEGNQMPKFQLRQNSTKIYFPVDGEDFAVVRSEGIGELPVSFKAEENGSYTLSLNTNGVSFGYLHLIDNMTGNDVDMLANPSYSFEARTTDYANRFKLVFATGDNANANFAFFSNGSFVINNDGAATLQVIDVNGRILKSESINGCANVNVNAAPGVYMIRLINGTDVKVQKVVVK